MQFHLRAFQWKNSAEGEILRARNFPSLNRTAAGPSSL